MSTQQERDQQIEQIGRDLEDLAAKKDLVQAVLNGAPMSTLYTRQDILLSALESYLHHLATEQGRKLEAKSYLKYLNEACSNPGV